MQASLVARKPQHSTSSALSGAVPVVHHQIPPGDRASCATFIGIARLAWLMQPAPGATWKAQQRVRQSAAVRAEINTTPARTASLLVLAVQARAVQ